MKFAYLKYLVFGLAIAASILSGCGDDATKDLTPKITVDASTMADNKEFIIKDGVAGSFKVKFVANKGADGKDLQTFIIRSLIDNVAGAEIKKTISGSTFNWDSTFQTTTRTPATIKYTFVIQDKDGKEASFSRTYTTKADGGPVVTKPINNTGSLSMANPCFNTANGQAYSLAAGQGVASTIDLTYLWTGTSLDNLVSPAYRTNDLFNIQGGNDYRIMWGSVSTELRKTSLTQSEFNAFKDLDESKLTAEFDKGTATVVPTNEPGKRASGGAQDVLPGKVLAFKTGGKVGLILINSVAGSATGNLSFTVLRQK